MFRGIQSVEFGQFDKAQHYLACAYQQGEIDALFYMGGLYDPVNFSNQDDINNELSVKFYQTYYDHKKGKKSFIGESAARIAVIYYLGGEYEKSFNWLGKSLKYFHWTYLYDFLMANYYSIGIGTEIDLEKSKYHLTLAAFKGHEESIELCKKFNYKLPITKDEKDEFWKTHSSLVHLNKLFKN